jgi:hypothetical protein
MGGPKEEDEDQPMSFQVGQKRAKCDGPSADGEVMGSPTDDAVGAPAAAMAVPAGPSPLAGGGSRVDEFKPSLQGGIGRTGRPLKSALKNKNKTKDVDGATAATKGPVVKAADLAGFKGTSSEDATCVMHIGGMGNEGELPAITTVEGANAWPKGLAYGEIRVTSPASPRTSMHSPSPKVAW